MDQNLFAHKITETKNRLFVFGATCALFGVVISLLEIGLSFLPGGAHGASESISVATWFENFRISPLFQLRNLGLINILFVSASVPLFITLFLALQRESPVGGLLALIVNTIGASVFFATNRAFAMYSLSFHYAKALSEIDRIALLAAGDAMLAVGSSHSMGSFLAFIISEIAGLIISIAMLRSKLFGKWTGGTGILAFTCLMLFETCSAFIPNAFNLSSSIAMVGGLLSIAWYILTAINLFKIQE